MSDSFSTRSQLNVGGKTYDYFSLPTLGQRFDISHLPYSMKILLENLLRHEDGGATVGPDHIEAVARWNPSAEPDTEIAFMPARVVLQDFTGVPCVVDLAAMRDAVVKLGGSPEQINPQIPSELVIDHSVQVDVFGKPDALDLNGKIEFQRNQERYGFLRWGQKAFENFKVVPPNTGIVHQVNLENLARVVMTADKDGTAIAYPDTVFGTDSHTTMINGIGVLGWNVDQARDALDPGHVHRTCLGAGADVIEHQLVGALVAVALCQLGDVAHVDVIAEAHALDHAPIAHIQAGNDAAAQHASASARSMRCSSKALPRMAPPQPASRASPTSATSRMPPDACTATPGNSAERCAYSPMFGPASMPSRAISVHSRWRMPARA